MAKTMAQISAGCGLDGRTHAGRLARDTRRALTAHVGGAPSVAQIVLIDRAVMLTLRLAQLDADMAAGCAVDDERHLAYSNSLSRIMTRLGLKSAPVPPPSLAEYMAARDREKVAVA
jgi:hypothetical protein